MTGCKVFVQRPISRDVPVEEVRKAEILSIRERKLGRTERKERKQRIKAGEKEKEKVVQEESVGQGAEDRLEYYIHYVEFNKVRLHIPKRKARRVLIVLKRLNSVSMNGFHLPASSCLEKSNGQSHHNLPQMARTTTLTPKPLANNLANLPSFLLPLLPPRTPPRRKSRKQRKLVTC